jgi:transposase
VGDVDSRRQFLATEGLLNSKPEQARHPLFRTHPFFDPLDLVQVRYEMLRSARVEGTSVADTVRLFGFSRQYFYDQERKFMDRGVAGLLSAPQGRTPLLARNQEIVSFIVQRKMSQPELTGEDLRQEIQATFRVACSRRTVERIIEKVKVGKKGLPAL